MPKASQNHPEPYITTDFQNVIERFRFSDASSSNDIGAAV
jgi:hypothetical protein